MTDFIREFLRRRGCGLHVVEGGLEYLVDDWERTAASVGSGEPQLDEENYLNDMDGRQIIADLFAGVSAADLREFKSRVERADELIRPSLVPTRECIWGTRNAEKHGYDRQKHWWYFHRPRVDMDFFE